MTEKQAEYNEALALERERFENELLTDRQQHEFWAGRFANAHVEAFTIWAWEQYERALTPQWTKAWENEV